MSGTELTQLGAIGIIATAVVVLAYTIRPLIQALVGALNAVIARWDESDKTLDKNTAALNSITTTLRELSENTRNHNDTEKLQNEANRTALADGVNTIRGDLIIAKDDAVNAITNTLNTSFAAQGTTMNRLLEGDEKARNEQKQTREHLERLEAKMDAVEAKMDTVLERLNQIASPPTPTPPIIEAAQAPAPPAEPPPTTEA